MADIITTSPEAAYATKPNILVPKTEGTVGKARIEARAKVELDAAMGVETAGRKSPAKLVTNNIPAMTTTQEA